MARETTWEWDKQGDFDGHASFHRTLPANVTISDVEAELHKWDASANEWVDWSEHVTISPTIVTALRRSGDTWVEYQGGELRGVRVVITADPDDQPDGDDEPKPGPDHRYQVKIIVTRSDTSGPDARPVPLRIFN